MGLAYAPFDPLPMCSGSPSSLPDSTLSAHAFKVDARALFLRIAAAISCGVKALWVFLTSVAFGPAATLENFSLP